MGRFQYQGRAGTGVMNAIGRDAAAGFEQAFGHPADSVWSAPGRVNLIGEHTDYNLGFVLPFAIDRRTAVALGHRDDHVGRVASSLAGEVIEIDLRELTLGSVAGWAAYPLGVAWALGQQVPDVAALSGFDIFVASNVPVGAGLSSSAAIESAAAIALDDAWHLGLDRRALAWAGHLAENEMVGAPTGIMDQSASMLGETDSAVFLDCRSLESHSVPLGLVRGSLAVLIIDSGTTHSHASGGYAERRASCELGARTLGVESLRDIRVADLARAHDLLDDVTFRRVRHIVTENQRVLDTVAALEQGGTRDIGDLLVASHLSMRDDFEISVPELDVAVAAALAGGAIGARMTGGGFGGAALALVDKSALAEVQDAVSRAFAQHRFALPNLFTVNAEPGARREGY
jgi:galactokinase